jgi:transposase
MARRTFDVIDVAEILVHWHAGRSLSEMAESLGVDRKTLRKYVAPAAAAGIVPGGPAKSEEEWHELVRGWFPELADTRLRQVTWPAIAVHHDYIVEQLKARVRMSTIHQRLRDERGLAASVASFRRYVNANLPEEVRRSQVTVWNPRPSEAGEQAQIDYGQLGRWLDPVSGKLRTVQAFVMVLPYSRHMFVRPVLKMDQRTWTECHVAAFEFFAGTPARLVPDNLKTGVDKPDLYDPKLNRSYAEMAAHYGCLIDPARALKPRDKPRVAYCTSSGRFVRSSRWGWSGVLRRAAGLGAVGRVAGVGRVVEDFAFIVIPLPCDNSGVVPVFDGCGGRAEQGGHLAERDQAGVEEPLAAAG